MNIHDIYRPFQQHFRLHRMRRFAERFRPDATTRVIDIGGYSLNWSLIGAAPWVVLVNLDRTEWDRCGALVSPRCRRTDDACRSATTASTLLIPIR
jgi:hypothetical protein